MPAPKLPKDVTAILASSFLAHVPTEETHAIISSGYRMEQDAGRPLNAVRDEPVVGLVLDGLVRVFLDSGARRQVTVRYARPGDALGPSPSSARRRSLACQRSRARSSGSFAVELCSLPWSARRRWPWR